MDDIYWGPVPVTQFWNAITWTLIHDILYDICVELQFPGVYDVHDIFAAV